MHYVVKRTNTKQYIDNSRGQPINLWYEKQRTTKA